MQRLAILLLIAAVGCATGAPDQPQFDPPRCGFHSEPTHGELGRARFVHDFGSFGCLFGCSADEALVERGRGDVVVLDYHSLPVFTVASDNPAVATFDYDPNYSNVLVDTLAPGDVRMELHDASTGELLDALPLRVRPVAAVEYSTPSYTSALTVMSGGNVYVSLSLRDADDCPMVGVGGVDYTLNGNISASQLTLVDALMETIFAGFFSTVTEHASIDAVAQGEGTIDIAAPSGATLTVPVAVVEPASAQRIALSAQNPMSIAGSHSINARAFGAGDEPIYDPACTWSIEPSSGPVILSDTGRDSAFVYSDTAGSAQVICTVGTLSGQVGVVFQ